MHAAWWHTFQEALPPPKSGVSQRWLEVCNESKPVLAMAQLVDWQSPALIVVPTLERAEQWFAVLFRLGIPEERLVRAPWGLTPLMGPTGVEPEVLYDRARARHALRKGEPVVVIAPVGAVLQHTMPVHQFEAEWIRLTSTENPVPAPYRSAIDPETLLHSLVEDGYEYQEPVRLPGHFARRGGIVDVFPMGSALPVRIEFWGDDIVSLRRFDPATQRSVVKGLRQVEIPPAREVPMGNLQIAERIRHDWEQAIARQPPALQPQLRQNLEDDLRPMRQGVPFNRLELYLPWLLTERACLIDYLPDDALLILDEPLLLESAYERMRDEVQQALCSRAERGDIIPLNLADYVAPLARLYAPCPQAVLTLESMPKPDLEGIPVELGTRSTETTRGRLPDLWNSIRQWHKAQYRIVIATDRPHQITRAFQDAELPAPTPMADDNPLLPPPQTPLLLQGNLGGGFVWDAQRFVLLTDAEFFDRHRLRMPPRRFNEGVPLTSIMDLQPGDYVVHIHHGVGIFRGLTTLERDGTTREYLLIEYAPPDRIFVPVDQLDRIQKYIGPDDKPPEIRRLTSSAWVKAVAQARQKAKAVAKELIQLYALREKATRPPTGPDTPWQAEMEAMFPYIETEGQLRAITEVKNDLESPHPMDRLLVGDVGFGKTEVALRAAFKVIMAERQVALMCPTTVLAYQHWQIFKERFEPFGVQVALLSRLLSAAEQKRILHALKTGAVDMVIGTHRLLSKDVQFKNLGLVIIDEEQRFGVMQKEQLKKLRGTVDVLTMTATPIPRTLYMALTEIRDMSLITDPPPGRLPIRTAVMPYTDWAVREAILRELQRDGQVFYVVPRVQGIEHIAEHLKKLVPHARIAVAHGQMPPAQMEAIVLDFYQHAHDILVCTTIIENGLDMPNVNTLIVESAERFGLGQLYQLRGRVGRSDRQAYAYFLFKVGKLGDKAEERLQALKEFSHLGSGFALAMRDLEIRGAGNLLGTEQHGAMRAVGLELYQAMLCDAIRHLRRGESHGSQNAPIEEELPPFSVPIDAYIPDTYIADTAQRLGYYKRIAGSRSHEELRALVRELRDRYGPLPQPLKNLLKVMELRLHAHVLGVASVQYENGTLTLRFQPDRRLKARWQLHLIEQIKGIRTQPEEVSLRTPRAPLDALALVLTVLKEAIEAG